MKRRELTPFIRKSYAEHVRRMETQSKSVLEKYVQGEGGKIKIDWVNLLRDHHNFIEGASDDVEDQTYSDMLRYLQIKGILTFEGCRGSFFVNGCGMNVNPRDGLIKYDFARKEDAEAFRKAEYGGVRYSTIICQNC